VISLILSVDIMTIQEYETVFTAGSSNQMQYEHAENDMFGIEDFFLNPPRV
jgi:hypothetical protein